MTEQAPRTHIALTLIVWGLLLAASVACYALAAYAIGLLLDLAGWHTPPWADAIAGILAIVAPMGLWFAWEIRHDTMEEDAHGQE